MSDAAIATFWRWWAASRDRLTRAIPDGKLAGIAPEIKARVGKIHPELGFETGPGLVKTHSFSLTGNGDPELRLLCEAWLAQAVDDDDWEFHPTRIATRNPMDLVLGLGEHKVRFDEILVRHSVDGLRERLDVELFHPLFALADERARNTIGFLALDNTLGEGDVEMWIGQVALRTELPEQAADFGSLLTLRDGVDGVRSTASGEGFAVLQGEQSDTGKPVFVMANLAAKRWAFPQFRTHLEVEVRYGTDNEAGLPDRAAQAWLMVLEDRLIALLEDKGVFLGRETCDGLRLFHVYTGQDGVLAKRLHAWAATVQGDVQVRASDDPQWSVLTRW